MEILNRSATPGTFVRTENLRPVATRVTLIGQTTGLRVVATLAPGGILDIWAGNESLQIRTDDDPEHPTAGLRPAQP